MTINPDNSEKNRVRIPDWTGRKILIVEDVETNMLFFKAALNRTKATLLWARDGMEAITMCQTDPEIKVVLMDLRMPNLDGFRATEAIKAIRPGLPVIAQTTFTDDVDTDRLFQAGCDDYLPKPIHLEDLLKAIGKFLTE